jgi:hypothetical protein
VVNKKDFRAAVVEFESEAARFRRTLFWLLGEIMLLLLVGGVIAALGGCSQSNEQRFMASCAVGRPPVEGELVPGLGKVGDYRTGKWPWSPSHGVSQYCKADGTVVVFDEQESPSSIASMLSDPIQAALSKLTLPVFPAF